MDTMHPAIQEALVRHEGRDFYGNLMIAVYDVNEVCQRVRQDADRLGIIMGRAMLDIQMHHQARRITDEQRDALLHLLKDGVEEPTEENNVPVFRLRFPSPDYDPPPRAA